MSEDPKRYSKYESQSDVYSDGVTLSTRLDISQNYPDLPTSSPAGLASNNVLEKGHKGRSLSRIRAQRHCRSDTEPVARIGSRVAYV